MWTVSVGMLHKLAEANNTFVRNLLELAKEIGEYHQSQKDKLKSNVSDIYCVCTYVCVRVLCVFVVLCVYVCTVGCKKETFV